MRFRNLNMNLLGSFTFPTTKCNDIWGWVDANENEFALVGLRNGVSCVGSKCFKKNKFNNEANVLKISKLRHQRANLLGYSTQVIEIGAQSSKPGVEQFKTMIEV